MQDLDGVHRHEALSRAPATAASFIHTAGALFRRDGGGDRREWWPGTLTAVEFRLGGCGAVWREHTALQSTVPHVWIAIWTCLVCWHDWASAQTGPGRGKRERVMAGVQRV